MTDFMVKVDEIEFMADQVTITSLGGSSNDRLYGQSGEIKFMAE